MILFRRNDELDTLEAAEAREIRNRRIAAARACEAWKEVQEVDLVPRGRGRLVHAQTDEVFSLFNAAAFDRSGRLQFNRDLPVHYFITPAGAIVLLEKSPRTWSEIVALQARQEKKDTA